MSFSYKPLWKLLIDRRMNKTDLKRLVGFNSDTLAAMSKNEPISMEKFHAILTALDCRVEDCIEFVNDHDMYPMYGKCDQYCTPGCEVVELDD